MKHLIKECIDKADCCLQQKDTFYNICMKIS